DKLQSGGSVQPLRFVPLNAAHQNLRHVCERLNVIDHRRLIPQSLLNGEWRLVPWLGTLAFDRFQQSALFAANVSAGTDEKIQLEREIASKDFLPQQSFLPAPPKLFLQDSFLMFVLVADVENALARPRNQACKNHSFDHQMPDVRQDVPVLKRSR